jgi:hypothetical protein
MSPACTTQRAFLHRVPYGCTDCPWYGKYAHLDANFLNDQPNLPKYWKLENNTFCDITTWEGEGGPLIIGDFDAETFGVEADNTNSTACTAL